MNEQARKAVLDSAAAMAAAFDMDAFARGVLEGIAQTIREFARRGVLPEDMTKKEA